MRALLLFFFLNSVLNAQSGHVSETPDFEKGGWVALLTGKDLTGWTSRGGKPHTWSPAKSVRWAGATNPLQLSAEIGPGPIIFNGTNGRTADLLTTKLFG